MNADDIEVANVGAHADAADVPSANTSAHVGAGSMKIVSAGAQEGASSKLDAAILRTQATTALTGSAGSPPSHTLRSLPPRREQRRTSRWSN